MARVIRRPDFRLQPTTSNFVLGVQIIAFRRWDAREKRLTKGHTARPMTNDRPLRRFRGHPVVPTLPRVERKKLITINRRDAAIAVFRVSPALGPLSPAECLVHPSCWGGEIYHATINTFERRGSLPPWWIARARSETDFDRLRMREKIK